MWPRLHSCGSAPAKPEGLSNEECRWRDYQFSQRGPRSRDLKRADAFHLNQVVIPNLERPFAQDGLFVLINAEFPLASCHREPLSAGCDSAYICNGYPRAKGHVGGMVGIECTASRRGCRNCFVVLRISDARVPGSGSHRDQGRR